SFITGMDTRIGYPNEHLAKSPSGDLASPMHATGVGLVIKGFQTSERKERKQHKSSSPKKEAGSGIFGKLFAQSINFLNDDTK
ncbi:MAG: hypothetical protein R6T83_02255, partial [Salinibacter sp.]